MAGNFFVYRFGGEGFLLFLEIEISYYKLASYVGFE